MPPLVSHAGAGLEPIDLAIVAVYLVVCLALGGWLGAGAQGLQGYFLGERRIPAWALMVSIVATETSTATFLSVPGVAYSGDFRFLQLALGYLVGRIVVAAVLLPAYFKGEIYTAYQVLDRRFGGATKTVSSLLFLVTRTLGAGLRLFLGAKVLDQVTGWGMPASIAVMGISPILYTYLGGMKAVVWTEVIQFFIYIGGALIALGILVGKIPGGWGHLTEIARAGGKFRMFDFSFDRHQPYTFWAGILGGTVLNTATHGADQLMVQRYLSARSQRQAAVALITSGVVVFVQFALFLLIGVGLFVFYRELSLNSGGGAPIGPARDEEFVWFIIRYLPTGILGLVMAAIFAASMSSLSSSLNASAASTVNDLVRPWWPNLDERQLLRLSRALTAAWGIVQMAVALGATRLQDNVVNNALAIASFVTGVLLGLFLLGILTRRVGQRAALVGLVVGLATVSCVAFLKLLAWPWYALVGSSTVFAVGLLASPALPEPPAHPSPASS